MENFLEVVGAVTAVGALYVVTPVIADAYRRFRGPRTVTCPESREAAEIGLDTTKAAVTAAFGTPELRVTACSRWPEHQHCGQECLTEVE
jgi:hypothetical protein